MIKRPQVNKFCWAAVLVSGLWALLLLVDATPALRGAPGWYWPHRLPPEALRLVPLAVALVIYAAIGLWLAWTKRDRALIAWSIAGTVGITLAVIFVRYNNPVYELYTRTLSGLTTGWHHASVEMADQGGTRIVLPAWTHFMESAAYSSHVSTSPPGLPTLYYTFSRILERLPHFSSWAARPLRAAQCQDLWFMSYTDGELVSTWLGMLMPLWGGLTVLPLWRLAHEAGAPEAGRWAVLWWPLIPSLVSFSPYPSAAFTLIAVLGTLLLFTGLRRSSPWRMVAAGAVFSFLLWLNFAALPLLFFAGLLALGLYFTQRKARNHQWHWPLLMGGWFAIGLASLWIAAYGIARQPAWALFHVMISNHFYSSEFSYWPWVMVHIYDFLMWMGLPLALLSGAGLWQMIRSARRKNAGSTMLVLPGVAMALTMLALDLSGILRGETGRIWLFMWPPLLLAAAAWVSDQGRSKAEQALITAAQAGVVVVLAASLAVIESGLQVPPPVPPPLPENAPNIYLDQTASFGNLVRLTGSAGEISINAEGVPQLGLWLRWESLAQAGRPYYLSVLPVAPDGMLPSASLAQPFGQAYPITCWKPADGAIEDRVVVDLPMDADMGGDWWISLALIDGDSGERLPVIFADGSQDVQVGIGPFRLAAAQPPS